MSEKALGRLLARRLGPRWVHTHHHDLTPGVPDYSYAVGGWLELKHRPAWPARAETPVRLSDGSWPAQRLFLRRRAAAGERCFVLLQVGRGLWLYRLADLLRVEGEQQHAWRAAACWVGDTRTADWGQLLGILTGTED